MKRRKPTDPKATEYRRTETALAKAEKRLRTAENAWTDLTAKLKRLERRMTPERLAEIKAGTVEAKRLAKERAERWKDAERVLRTAARVAGLGEISPRILGPSNTGFKRVFGLAIPLTEGSALIWHSQRGYMTGKWSNVVSGRLGNLKKIGDEPPMEYREAA